MPRLCLLLLISIFGLSVTESLAGSEDFVVHAGEHERKNVPITSPLPESLQNADSLFVRDVESNKTVPAQALGESSFVFVPPNEIPAGESRRYRLSATDFPWAPTVKTVKEFDRLSFRKNGKAVLSYNTATVIPPEGADPLYRRSGHIHPFITPAGRVVTDEFPSDHYHQHAIFAAWTKTSFEGERVDFWNQKAGTGNVEHREVISTKSGQVFGEFKVRLAHVVTKGEPRDVLDEVWTVRLYHVDGINLFDIESVQKCVAKTPLTLDEYHYGGFAFRGSSEWIANPEHKMITNETDDRKAGNHTRPKWTAIYGPVDGEICGAAMISSTSNFRSPQPVRLHPTMPYFVYSPCVLGSFDLEPGKVYHSRYRYAAFDGPPKPELLDQLWASENSAPRIEWIESE